uniref:Aldose 1-epimerase n=1 Tax=Daphnia galeata TaxID=27404 RepID=A0A8J2RSV9_9CRUS|nr:unnamed protein product [Daphnia galeata]
MISFVVYLLLSSFYIVNRFPFVDTGTLSTPVIQELFGTIQTSTENTSVTKFTITNRHGVKVQLITYGAALNNFLVPDKEGRLQDVVLGFDDLDGYRGVKARNPYFGSTVGRVANRIAKGHFRLDGVEYQLATNNGRNHLHGGNLGFDKVVWQAYAHKNGSVTFSYSSPHMEEGYPGQLFTQVTYTLTDSNELIIDFKALTDLPTPVNLVNHAYFNLAGHAAGSQQLYNHRLQLYANQYTPVNSEKIPTGELASVNGTAFDLRSETRLGDVINLIPGGYDHNFVASISTFKFYKTLPLVANLWHPESGRFMQIFSNQPGFQLYTGNVLPTDDSLEGKNGTSYKMHDGLCIETQNFPNAINQPNFPDSVLRPGTVYHRTTVFKFSIK